MACGTLAACAGGPGQEEKSADDWPLTLAGSSTILPLAEQLAERYQSLRPEAVIDVQGGGSSVGVSSALNGLADIGMVSRALQESERASLTPITVAYDGIAFIAHASNTVADLSSQQVEQVYTGAITNWAAVGGRDAPIVVINKEEGRATLHVVEEHFELRGRFVKNAVVIGPNGQAITTVAGNPDAIAYVSFAAAEAARRHGTPIRLLSLDEVVPTAQNLRSGDYAIKRPLLLVTGPAPSITAREFLSFILSPPGQQTVAKLGFVPVSSDDDPNAGAIAAHDQESAQP